MISAKDYGLKRPFSHTLSQATPSLLQRDLEGIDTVQSLVTLPCPVTYTRSCKHVQLSPLVKKQRLQSLTDFPNEILLGIQSYLTHPLDLLHFSHCCVLLRSLADEKAWHRLYIYFIPTWSKGTEVRHLRHGANLWKHVVVDDFLQRSLYWIDSSDRPSPDDAVKCLRNTLEPLRLRVNLSLATHIKPAHMDAPALPHLTDCSRWRNVGPPASHTDPASCSTISAYMQARTCGDHKNHQIVIYRLPNHDKPLAIIPGDFWVHSGDLDPDMIADNLTIAQLMDIKQFPTQKDDQGRMRIVLVVAFGESHHILNDATDADAQFLDVWQLIKVVEIYICGTPQDNSVGSTTNSIGINRPRLIPYRPDPIMGRVETIVTSSGPEQIRGRAVKLYTAPHPSTGQATDHIALFGIHEGSRQQAIVMTSPLFVSTPPATMYSAFLDSSIATSEWDCYALGGLHALESSCMALFPPQSDFEHLLVIMDRKGRGEVWDWLHKVRVAALLLPDNDMVMQDKRQDEEEHFNHRKDLYYWGVQVNWAVEEPGYAEQGSAMSFGSGPGYRRNGDFRIVALADGRHKEWETCWWHISENTLRNRQHNSCMILPSSRHFEQSTLGTAYTPSLPQRSSASSVIIPGHDQSASDREGEDNHVLFIAYLIWDHYRIALTSNYGLCMFDMNQEANGDCLESDQGEQLRQPQWITFIDKATDDPLIDIATVGDCLFLTRKYSHMIWPFRRPLERLP
ncbi:hypothetical protein BGZ98_005433 [Dissophora globulifera]|nr:hypothetical protein BGZ98_005433 [Dissophora globulifera]